LRKILHDFGRPDVFVKPR